MNLVELYKEYKAVEGEYTELMKERNFAFKEVMRQSNDFKFKPITEWPEQYRNQAHKISNIISRLDQLHYELVYRIPLDTMIQVDDFYVAHLSGNVLKELRLHESS